VADRLALFTGGVFAESHAKTAHGILRYGPREVVCVVDTASAGALAREVVPYARRDTPIVATVEEAVKLGSNVLVIGVAPFGGALTAEWRAALLEAIGAGMHVEAGLHTVLSEDPELSAAAAAAGVELRDLRAAPPGLSVPAGPAARPQARVVHTVGSDCAIGKMSVTLELDAAARARGLESAFVATGQTGIAITGWGIAVDHVISDFISGAAARLVSDGAQRAPLLFVEGQGALGHPAYSGVTLGLLHGCLPDALVLCHKAGSTFIDDYPETPIPPLGELIALYEGAIAWVRPAPVVAIALNTRALDDDEARAACEAAAAETGLPATDPVRFGAGPILEAVV
jgi:D-glutamate N-acetyltransferase